MATLEERLARREWDPTENDELIGNITAITEASFARDDGTTHWYPVLVVRDDNKTEWEVRCSRGRLFNPIVAKQPRIGDRIGLKYAGMVATGRGDAHRYKVVFDEPDEPIPVDWARMTGQQSSSWSNGDTDATSDASAWPAAPATETPATEDVPF